MTNSLFIHVTPPTGRLIGALLLAAGLALAYPTSGTLNVTGPSDFVGQFTINPAPGNNESQVSGYGGAYAGTIAATTYPTYTQMLFCDDFANDVGIPSGNVGVNISPLAWGAGTPTQQNNFDNNTRFGDVTSWRSVQSYLPSGDTLTTSVQNTINGATALQRYEMAAYLMSNYTFFNTCCTGNGTDNTPPGSTTVYSDATNTGIQSAVWAVMDPTSDLYLPPTSASQDGNIVNWLTCAADWLNNTATSTQCTPTGTTPTDTGIGINAGQFLLSRVQIVSDAAIGNDTTLGTKTQVGIQELIIFTTPEPSFYAVLALGLVALFWAARRKRLLN